MQFSIFLQDGWVSLMYTEWQNAVLEVWTEQNNQGSTYNY